MLMLPADRAYGEKLTPITPEYFLAQAPVGTVIRSPRALLLSRWLWSVPLIHGAGPLRDYAVHGSFKGRAPSNTDFYAYSEHGDTLDYSISVLTEREGIRRARIGREQVLTEGLALYAQARKPEDRRRVFLTDRAVAALAELAALVAQDGAKLALVAHDSTAGLVSRNPLYREARRPYYIEMSRAAGLPVIDFLDDFNPFPYEIADTMHLNVHGAQRFARMLAAQLDGRPDPEAPRREAPDVARIDPQDPTFNMWSAVVLGEGRLPHRTLEIQVVQSMGTPAFLTGSPVRVLLRQPDDSDLALRAKVVEPGRILVDASRVEPGDRVLVARVVSSTTGRAWPLPLAAYHWSSVPFPVDGAGKGQAKLRADVARAMPGQGVGASWGEVKDPAADDWIGLFPEGGPDEAWSQPVPSRGGSSGSVLFEIPANVPAGSYELRMFAHGGWRRLATSPPFEVLPSPTVVEAVGGPFRAGGTVDASWRQVVSPAKDDWIGVFPAGEGDAAQVASAPTGGGETGTLHIKVPVVSPGSYELRLFAKGGWERRAVSPRFRLHRPEAR
jgi:hypothetical protein